MSIQEFQTQLTQADQQNPLMGALSRLSLLEDLTAVTNDTVQPMDGWTQWASNSVAQ
jgi:hypothetical protein